METRYEKVKALKKRYPVFPRIDRHVEHLESLYYEDKERFRVKIQSLLRFKREGKWYLRLVGYEYLTDVLKGTQLDDKILAINAGITPTAVFMAQIYQNLYLGQLLKENDTNNVLYDIEDDDQTDEVERLKNMIP